MATFDKDDKKWLKKNFATNKDLKNLLTKDDARNFITKSDDDVNSIKNLITVAVDDAIEKKQLVTKDDISHLPTKDEFYKESSKIYKKMEDIETEIKLVTKRVSNHSDEIDKLKSIHPNYQHAS